jgi:hypothetical protein
MGNMCCAREHSVQFFVQFFYTFKLHLNTQRNFISLHLEEKSVRYDFVSRSKRCKLKPRSKNFGTVALRGGI